MIFGTINAADDWIGINHTHLYDNEYCGEEYAGMLGEALDGTANWEHYIKEEHWFILDLGETYTIKSVCGRSNFNSDPTRVDIYVSDDLGDWGLAVALDITTWRATNDCLEVDTDDKDGRYIKVVVKETADPDLIAWGGGGAPFTIFDAYGSVSAPAVEVIPVGYQEWSTSSSWSYGSGTALTTSTSNAVELDLPKPTSHPSTSTDDVYWGIGIPATTSQGTYKGTTTFGVKSD